MFPETDIAGDSYVIAWHGICAPAASWRSGWLQIAENLTRIGYAPTHFEMSQGDRISKIKKYTAKQVDMIADQWDSVTGISLYTMPPGARDNWIKGSKASIDVEPEKQSIVVVVVDQEAPDACKVACEEAVEPLLGLLPFAYGLGCGLPINRLPTLFVSGHYVGGGTPGCEEPWQAELSERSDVWDRYIQPQALWKDGIFRDTYSRNYLTEPLLNAQFGEDTLRNRIDKEHGLWGELYSLSSDRWRWDIPINRIGEVKSEMLNAGRILSLEQAQALYPR